MQNMTAYLSSDQGGAFKKSEIVVLYDPTYREVIEAKKWQQGGVYALTYASAHGFSRRADGMPFVSLADGSAVSLNGLRIEASFHDIVLDSCRTVLEPAYGFSGLGDNRTHSHLGLSFNQLTKARYIFDRKLENRHIQQIILLAAQKGKNSVDTYQGGKFTNALLKQAYRQPNRVQTLHDLYQRASLASEAFAARTRCLIKASASETISFQDGSWSPTMQLGAGIMACAALAVLIRN